MVHLGKRRKNWKPENVSTACSLPLPSSFYKLCWGKTLPGTAAISGWGCFGGGSSSRHGHKWGNCCSFSESGMMFLKFLSTLGTWNLLSVSVRQACINLKLSMKFMFRWPAGFGPCICLFKSLVLSSPQSSLKSVAGSEGALCLQLGDVAGFGKA